MWAPLFSHRNVRPFAITAHPRVAFESTAFRAAFLALTNAIAMRAGLVVLIGEAGCGKTVLLRTLRDAHARGNCPVFVRHAVATDELLPSLLKELHIVAIPADRDGRLQVLAERLTQRRGPALLLVDEGDMLSRHELAELAALAAWRRGEPDGVQVVLAGRPALAERLRQQRFADIARQVFVTTHLGPLLRQEIGHYIAHHLALGRCGDVSFDAMALDRLYMHSQGIPFSINLLGKSVLERGRQRIEARHVDAAAHVCGLAPNPSGDAITTAGTHQPVAPRRAPGRMLRVGYRSSVLAGFAGLAFATAHLLPPIGDVMRYEADALVRDYIAAATKVLIEPGKLMAPVLFARPLASNGTMLAQNVTETAPAAAPPEALQGPRESDPGTGTENEGEPAPVAANRPAPTSGPSLPPVITHLWPGGEGDAALSGSAEASPDTAGERAAQSAENPIAQAPLATQAPSSTPDPPSGAISPSAAPVSPPVSPRGETLDTDRLLSRGHALLEQGDVAAARLLFERAAAAGLAAAMTALGQSFDPLELQRRGVIGVKPDPVRALEWYRAANAAGDPAARDRSARLTTWVERGQTSR